MALKNIKGITIEIDGNAKGLNDALKDVNKTTRGVQRELRQVDGLLKFDPGNVELLSQRQRLLSQAVESTTQKLDALRQAEAEVQRQFESGEIGEEAFREFRREIIATEGRLQAFQRNLENTNARIEVETSDSDLRETESRMKKLGSTAKTVGKEIGAGLKKGFEVGVKAAAGLTAAVGAAGVGANAFVEANKELNTALSRLRTNAEVAGFDIQKIEEGFKRVVEVTGDTGAAVETVSNLMQTGFSESQLAEALEYVNGAAIAFSDTLKTEGIADGIQETFATGKAIGPFAELLERSGVNIEKFDAGLAKAAKAGKETDYVLQQLAATGIASNNENFREANKSLVAYNEAQLESQIKAAELATAMQPLATAFLEIGNLIMDMVLGNVSLLDGFNRLIEIVSGLGKRLITTATEAIPKFIQGITDNYPKIFATGMSILDKVVDGISRMFPKLISTALDLVLKVATTIMNNLPKIIDMGVKLIVSLINGLTSQLPKIQSTALTILTKLVSTLIANLPNIINAAIKIVVALITGLIKALPQMTSYLVTKFIPGMVKAFVSADWKGIGKSIILGLINGVKSMAGSLVKSVKGVIGDAVGGAKKLLGINSPSRVFMEIGEFTNEGFIKGIEKTKKSLYNTMNSVYGSIGSSAQKSTANTVAQQTIINNSSGAPDLTNLISAIQTLVANPTQLLLDGKVIAQTIVDPVAIELNRKQQRTLRG